MALIPGRRLLKWLMERCGHGELLSILLTATAKHDDEVQELEDNGGDATFNLYAEAGQGYADFVRDTLD